MSRTTRRRRARPARTRSQATYARLLKDPRWQKKRLEVFNRDRWTCQGCRATTKELQVHHTRYAAGGMPWDVPLRDLVTLCIDCHRIARRR
jgi:5-methylcytosine-specific restriction endonuclease McrA